MRKKKTESYDATVLWNRIGVSDQLSFQPESWYNSIVIYMVRLWSALFSVAPSKFVFHNNHITPFGLFLVIYIYIIINKTPISHLPYFRLYAKKNFSIVIWDICFMNMMRSGISQQIYLLFSV